MNQCLFISKTTLNKLKRIMKQHMLLQVVSRPDIIFAVTFQQIFMNHKDIH